MIQISNVNNQLVVTWANNLTDHYAFEDIKSVTPYTGPSGDLIVINFINENRNSSLKIPFIQIDNQPSWTDVVVAAAAISAWMDTSIGSGLATEATLQNVETNTTGVARTPGFIREVNAAGDLNSVVSTFYSVSVANVGSADGTVLGEVIRPGEILNFSADSLNNFFTSFPYAATGTEFIIIFVS